MKKRLKKIGKIVFQGGLIAFFVLCIVEMAYRYQWFDAYSSEWEYHNAEKKTSLEKTSILVFGDSFTANKTSWISSWNTLDSSLQIWNASVPGIGVETHRLMFADRLEESKPKHVIVQLYVGNDLIDIHKPINWSEYGVTRNLFWSFSNRFRILNFMNYRMGQVSQDVVGAKNPKLENAFSSEKYSERTKLYIKGDENYPRNSIRLKSDQKSTFDKQIKWLKAMKTDLPEGCKMHILVIPHCTQISKTYIDRYSEMGAVINKDCLNKDLWSKLLRKQGFSVFSPLEYFQKLEKKGEQMYFNNDPHLTDLGQEELASFIHNKMKL